MTTDPLSECYAAIVEQVRKRKESGEFLRLLRECEPGPPYRLSSEGSSMEPLLAADSRDVEKRRAAVIVSDSDLLGVEHPPRPGWANEWVRPLMAELREQMTPQPPPPSAAADPDRNPMWHEWTTNKHHEALGSRTFVRNDGGSRSLLQDRLTATVAIPELRLVVFAALIWERTATTD